MKCNKWKLNRSRKISSNFYQEKNQIRSKFSSSGYLMRSVNSAINDFGSKEHDPMTPNYLFNDSESTPIVLIDIPFCNENEKVSKQLLKKLKVFTTEKYDFRILWKTKKVRQLFEGEKSIPSFVNSFLEFVFFRKGAFWILKLCG